MSGEREPTTQPNSAGQEPGASIDTQVSHPIVVKDASDHGPTVDNRTVDQKMRDERQVEDVMNGVFQESEEMGRGISGLPVRIVRWWIDRHSR